MINVARSSQEINVIIHYPETEEGMQAFRRRFAEAQVQMIKDQILKLDWPPEKKEELFEMVKEEIRIKAEKKKKEEMT